MSTDTETKTPTIEDPNQASTNFYWLYASKDQTFNLQTTIRGILTPAQIQEHIKSALESCAHVHNLGGQAKQVGKQTETQGAPLPQPTPLAELTGADAVEPHYEDLPLPTEEPSVPQPPAPDTFVTEKLVCEIKEGKQYFKVKGGAWKKFGVVIWPEVLVAAGISTGKLEGKEYNLPNYRATYTKKADGKPEKITKLEKV